jgi:hypothetical protein
MSLRCDAIYGTRGHRDRNLVRDLIFNDGVVVARIGANPITVDVMTL